MAQTHVDNPGVIYNVLVGDSTFMNLVGTRTFQAGNTQLDAISIVSPGADLPQVKSISGMEVMIHDISDLKRKYYITNDVDIVTVWKVFLIAWPGATGTTLNNAAKRIMQLFSNATTIETLPVSNGLGAITQVLTLIPSNSIVLD